MSREILFRGYQRELKKWVYGSLIKLPNGACFIFDYKNNFEDRIEVSPDSVGQYTGSNTQFGVKIFEGDILDKRYKWVISFIIDAFYAKNELRAYLIHDIVKKRKIAGVPIEIIGNIYENSNLLPMLFLLS